MACEREMWIVQNTGSGEFLSELTTSKQQANDWAAECELHESQPVVRVVRAEGRECLQMWAANSKGYEICPQMAATMPPCEGWYPLVDKTGIVTGELIEAQERCSFYKGDESLGCMVQKS